MDLQICDSDNENLEDEVTKEDGVAEIPVSGKSPWADAMSKVLHSCPKSGKRLILAKAKHDAEIKKKKIERSEIEIISTEGQVLKDDSDDSESKSVHALNKLQRQKELLEQQVKRQAWENMCRSKADSRNKEKERQLMKVATRSVVQLFNAVQKHQKVKDEKIGITSRKESLKQQKAVKGNFLDILKSSSVKSADLSDQKTHPKQETWSVLKEDFMVGSTLKDWDKNSDDDI